MEKNLLLTLTETTKRYYRMTEASNKRVFTAEWGLIINGSEVRQGASVYSMSQWKSKFESKIAGGYIESK